MCNTKTVLDDRPASRLRLQRKLTPSGRHHAYTSSDMKGFYVTGATMAEARREAILAAEILGRHYGRAIDFDFI